MTKSTQFLPVKTTHSVEDYADLYIHKVVRLHGIKVSIILDRGAHFTTRFLKSFKKIKSSNVNLSPIFLSASGWKRGVYYPDIRIYVEVLHDWFQGELG